MSSPAYRSELIVRNLPGGCELLLPGATEPRRLGIGEVLRIGFEVAPLRVEQIAAALDAAERGTDDGE